MISVAEALQAVTALFEPLNVEHIALRDAVGRVLAEDVAAKRDQPPFAASSMDGYALRNAEVAANARFTVIGESAAGAGFTGVIKSGQAARIFTGAPVPEGADRVIIQEDISRDGDVITINAGFDTEHFIRPAGFDFLAGQVMHAPKRLTAQDVALLASMNCPDIPVFRKPLVGIIATGNELVMPGEDPEQAQIIASNNFGLAALFQQFGAEIRMIPIARDTPQSLKMAIDLCDGVDLIVTIGGASVGDHDIVRDVTAEIGMVSSFYKVAMRPGKPLMAGMLGETPLIGLPGNPVSSMVCGHIFIRPALSKMQGLGDAALPRELAQLGADLPQNGPREHYMRAQIGVEYSRLTVHPFARQDSALLSVLARANGFLVCPPNSDAKRAGDLVEVIRF